MIMCGYANEDIGLLLLCCMVFIATIVIYICLSFVGFENKYYDAVNY